jgi:NAD(P)-dependent dehydrogenase (short-subunit alcohol dehydrogenase family)
MKPKTILITGASSGIGEATAKYFWQQGWNVVATMRDPEKASHWIDEANVFCLRLDVTDPETITAAIAETSAKFGRIDVLVNNAGYALMGPMEGVTREQLDRQFETNVFGVVSTMQAVLPMMRQQGSGTIINVASIGGRLAFPMIAAYHGTKWAIEGITEAMRYELRPLGIRVKIIEPGGIKTNFTDRGTIWTTHPDYAETIGRVQQFMRKIDEFLPEPAGVAKTIYRAATDRSERLRYSPHGEILLRLHALLPDRLWRAFVERMMLSKR